MKREKKNNLKNRTKSILNGDYNTIDIDDTYLLATGDYQIEEMDTAPLSSLREPLWDWFTILNKKTKKIWYVDFSCPYTNKNFTSLTEREKINLGVIDLYYRYAYDLEKDHKLFSNFNYFKKADKYYDHMKDYYQKYNNWDLTFKSYEKKMKENEAWDEDIVVLYNDIQDFCAIMPHRYLKKSDMTIKDVFKEILLIIKNGKVKPKDQNKKYKKLIDEINFDLNLFDKEKNVERFI